ncbi:unnamed protein product [Rhizoctonia solani]|uniref:DUF6533 domain-containing protein n=1 Tax=Rhizoctonia solani TaxID=456999 RepID=A0A8H3HMJ5_9AGAM|nr:unnamed protein product [Rhizoctonia solani]
MSLFGLPTGELVDTIVFYHGQHQLAKYIAIVSLTLLVYDWIINIDLEVEFVWRASWSWGRVIYHANRIWSLTLLGTVLAGAHLITQDTIIVDNDTRQLFFLWMTLAPLQPLLDVRLSPFFPSAVDALSVDSCTRVGFMYSYGGICQYSIISTMFLLRCWALFDKKRVVWMLCGGFVGTVIIGVFVANFIISFLDNPLPNIFSGCYILIPGYLWMPYVAPLIYESTLFGLTLWRIYSLSKGIGATPLLQTLAQNGVAYFATLVLLVILGFIGATVKFLMIAANGSGLFTAISSIVCSHLIFSLYEITGEETLGRRIQTGTRSSGLIPQFAIPLQSFTTTQYST